MSTVVDFIFGSPNKKNGKTNGKTNSLNKNIPEISSAKKTLNELINKIIKLIAEKNELQEELNKMKKNKEVKEAQEANKEAQTKNSKSLLDQIVKFDGYLSNIHESLSKEDTEKLLTEIQSKIRNNKSLNTQIANTIKLNRNNANVNANTHEEEEVKEVFHQNNSKRNIKKSPESLEELLGISKNNRANNFKMNNRAQNLNSAAPRVNNNAALPNSAAPRVNNNAARPNSAAPRVNNNAARPNSAAPRVNNALSNGLSSIAGIFLNQNKKINAETYNELNKLSSSIHNLER